MNKTIGSNHEKLDFINRWILSFASDASKDILNEHVFKKGNFLWHVFSWGHAPCLEGDKARKAFDGEKCEMVYMFTDGYSKNGFPQIQNITVAKKGVSDLLETENDIYIVDLNFNWTYVHTHESYCGPYFAKAKDYAFMKGNARRV